VTAATKWDLRFLGLAKYVAEWSKDPSTQTGSVLVSPDRKHVVLGYNGFPADMPDTPEVYANREEKYSRIIHCEMNAVLNAKADLQGYTVYTHPFLSCDRCAVHLLQAGVKRFVAPRLEGEAAARWEPAFVKTRAYILECGATFLEVKSCIEPSSV
jgi:dCMP deaminase